LLFNRQRKMTKCLWNDLKRWFEWIQIQIKDVIFSRFIIQVISETDNGCHLSNLRASAGVAANPFGLEKVPVALWFKCGKFKYFLIWFVYPTDKVVSTIPKSVVVLPMSYLINPKPDWGNKKRQKRKQFQSHSSGIIVPRTYVTI
jgi:hypothetical protein